MQVLPPSSFYTPQGRDAETTSYESLRAAHRVVAGEGGDVQSARGREGREVC